MNTDAQILDELRRENQVLRHRLEEVEGIVRAISNHEVDAFVVQQEGNDRVLVLDGVDRPYRLLIERMQQGAAVLVPDGSAIYANQRLADLLCAPLASLVGSKLTEHVQQDDRPAFDALLAMGASADQAQELTLIRGAAASFPALVSVSPRIEPTEIRCLIVTDITQQKRHEAERAARAAAEQAAEFLRSADQRKDEFLAILGHELRNPLAPLRNGLQILNLIGAKEMAAQQVHEMMTRQLESLARLVDDLLDVGRVTQGKIELRSERADLKLILMRSVESCRTFIDGHNHHLELDLPRTPVLVDADAVRLIQVISNLLNNAAKFTPRGGNISVKLSCDHEAHHAVVTVKDDGRGIAQEMLSRIFDLYAQADHSASRAEGGLGIGLTLARRVVELHGGTIEASSAGLDRGSEFVMRLPLAPMAEPDISSHSRIADDADSGAVARRRILVVDDNRDSAASLVMLLRLLGHDVRDADNGQSALAILSEFVPDLVLLDLGMPGMSGYDVAARIKSEPALSKVRLVALSGYGGAEDRQRSQGAGFDDHLVKPVGFGALQGILASVSPSGGCRRSGTSSESREKGNRSNNGATT
jgi:signal transduction histidine kinase/ActR/RegA family two-component response regulator